MKWTERYEGYGDVPARACDDPELVRRLYWNGAPARWLFPMIRKDNLERLFQFRYGRNYFQVFHETLGDVPVFDRRGFGHRYDYFDLRIVARFAPRPALPSMWRCRGCGQPVFRRSLPSARWDGSDLVSIPFEMIQSVFRAGIVRECSPRCLLKLERRRQREWQKILLCRNLLKQARRLSRPSPKACGTPSGV